MGLIVFNDISSRDLNVEVETYPKYSTPQKNYDVEHIAGRNGDLISDQGSYDNIEVEYEISIAVPNKISYVNTMSAVGSWLNKPSGYVRLEDSYDPEHYRMAYYNGPFDMTNVFNRGGKGKLTFNCAPYRYLKTGENPISISSNEFLIRNPTEFTAEPYILVQGSGTGSFSVNDVTCKILKITNNMTIDSETYECSLIDDNGNYYNLNNDIEMTPVEYFPFFKEGINKITFSGGITRLVIIPRWREI